MAESLGSQPGVRGFDSRSRRCEQSQYSEVTRPDEDTVLKTAAGQTVVGSSPTASASTWERFHTGGCNPSAFNCVVVGERCDSLRSHFQTRPWCNGSTADSKPVSQGSNPWGRAFWIDSLRKSCGPTATTPVLHTGNDGSIPSRTTCMPRYANWQSDSA